MWQEWAFYWVSPFTLALEMWFAATVALWFSRRRLALALSTIGLAGLWVASMPIVADGVTRILESRYPALTPEATPAGDAIVILGGAVAGAQPPERPTFVLGASSTRVVHAAALYRAGKAKWIIVTGGNRPGHE